VACKEIFRRWEDPIPEVRFIADPGTHCTEQKERAHIQLDMRPSLLFILPFCLPWLADDFGCDPFDINIALRSEISRLAA
jgi:hypothetical protein